MICGYGTPRNHTPIRESHLTTRHLQRLGAPCADGSTAASLPPASQQSVVAVQLLDSLLVDALFFTAKHEVEIRDIPSAIALRANAPSHSYSQFALAISR